MLWHRFLVTGDPITDELITHIVDEILIPYAKLKQSPRVDSSNWAVHCQMAAARQ